MSDLSFDPLGGWRFLAGVAAILVALLWLGPDRSKTTLRQRSILTGIRLAVIALVALILARPAFVVRELTRQSATLVLLVDRSRSMQVADSLGGKSRFESLRALLARAEPELARIAETMEIRVYAFDSAVRSLPLDQGKVALEAPPDGEQSAIGAALEEVVAREAGKRIVGIVLASDGAQRALAPFDQPPAIAASRVADLGYPLYTLTFGQAGGVGQARDLAVEDLLVSPTVYVKNQLEVAATVRALGYSGKELTVQLLYEVAPGKMEVVAAQKLPASGDGRPQPVRFRHAPDEPGEHKLTLQVAEESGELVTTNNRSSTFVTVLEGGLNILYFASGYPREQRDVRWSLASSPDLALESEYFGRLKRDRDRWPLDLAERLRSAPCDAILIGDVDAGTFSEATWQAIADRVDAGAGLMMIGGYHSFGPGGFLQSPLAGALPITFERLERQNFDEPPSADLHLAGPIRMRPSVAPGGVHPLLQLDATASGDNLWVKLPPLDGANRFRGLKRGAVVLAESADDAAAPLLVAGAWGKGRVLAFAGDSTYRWIEAGYEEAHRRFWRQTILWLAQKDETRDGAVWIKLANRRFQPGAKVTFTTGLAASPNEPAKGAIFKAEVISPSGERKTIPLVRETPSRNLRGIVLDTLLAGDYTLEVTATPAGAAPSTTRSRFLVFDQDLELDSPAANPGLMASLAAQTSSLGGRALAAEELPALLKQLADHPPDLEIETETRKTYWDTWPVLLAFVSLLGTEWYLRKKWGLV